MILQLQIPNPSPLPMPHPHTRHIITVPSHSISRKPDVIPYGIELGGRVASFAGGADVEFPAYGAVFAEDGLAGVVVGLLFDAVGEVVVEGAVVFYGGCGGVETADAAGDFF